jgi:phage baseplate assembly protein W
MAIRDTAKKPFIDDRNNNVSVGLDLPIRKGNNKDGWFASTKTTINSTKNNLINLLNTNMGERLMQPNLGLNLRKYVFNQITPTLIAQIQEDISVTIKRWMPFVEIQDMQFGSTTGELDSNIVKIRILFNIKQDPNTKASIQVSVGGSLDSSIEEDSDVGDGTIPIDER